MEFVNCSFAFPGTYGQECGAPAVKVGVRVSDMTCNGVFYARRCEECTKHKGGENAGIIGAWLDFQPELHVNQWK